MAVRCGVAALAVLILGGIVWKYKRRLQLVYGYINSMFECFIFIGFMLSVVEKN